MRLLLGLQDPACNEIGAHQRHQWPLGFVQGITFQVPVQASQDLGFGIDGLFQCFGGVAQMAAQAVCFQVSAYRAVVVAKQIVAAYRELAVWLGEQIGVGARIDPPEKLVDGEWKAIGAGNELGVVLGARDRLEPDIGTSVEISQDGVCWL